MKYFTVALCLIVSACADYAEADSGCNIIIEHKSKNEGRHVYVAVDSDTGLEYSVLTMSVFAVGDCLKLTKVGP